MPSAKSLAWMAAVALAAVLGAARCDIYTDVDGVFSADPRIVPDAHRIPRIGHDHMVELAQRGAGYARFALGALAELVRLPRPDVVVALSTPPLIATLGLLAQRLRG